MKLAIMQPYLFPYLGYFQLVSNVDIFVFYDDVSFIKGGWINGNRILVNNDAFTFKVPCIKASQNKLINEIEFDYTVKEYQNILKTIKASYKKAPYFEQVVDLISLIMNNPSSNNICDLAVNSVKSISEYLTINVEFKISSRDFPQTKDFGRADRLIEITKLAGANTYINSIGGQELYEKKYFENANVNLKFLKPQLLNYQQFNSQFVPGLSIIDILMFNSPEKIKNMLDQFELV